MNVLRGNFWSLSESVDWELLEEDSYYKTEDGIGKIVTLSRRRLLSNDGGAYNWKVGRPQSVTANVVITSFSKGTVNYVGESRPMDWVMDGEAT